MLLNDTFQGDLFNKFTKGSKILLLSKFYKPEQLTEESSDKAILLYIKVFVLNLFIHQ